VEALNALAAKQRVVKEAEAAHNRNAVDSLWEDDERWVVDMDKE
jgi:predicted GTPase